MFPQINLIGRLIKDPEFATTNNNLVYCKITIAAQQYKNNRYQTNFFNFVVWNKRAEYVSQNFKKGDSLYARGYLTNSKYTNNKGETIYTNDIVVEAMEKVLPKKEEQPLDQLQDLDEGYHEDIEAMAATLNANDPSINY